MIRIQGLHKYYNKKRQNEIHVINNVTLDLPERGMVAIFGKSGCGKTTLLNVIGGLDKFDGGSLSIEGKSNVAFIIGGSLGLSAEVSKRADYKLSFSKMTFPHHLARVMVLEQIYRAEAIQAGSKYHK